MIGGRWRLAVVEVVKFLRCILELQLLLHWLWIGHRYTLSCLYRIWELIHWLIKQ